MAHRIGDSQFARFALVGGANTTVHWLVYLVLWLALPYLLAHVLATAAATACSYLLNCRFTFGVLPTARSLVLFPLSSLALLGVSTLAVAVAVIVFGVDQRLAPLVGFALVPASFLATRTLLTERGRGDRAWRAVTGVGAGTAALGSLPLLVNPTFYFTDDSAAQFLPMWHRLGERLLAGEWSLGLEPDSWMGGNLAAEALFGIWNPVNLADFALVALIGDLGVAAALVKIQFLVVLATGTFLLCREHGAKPGPSSAVAVALPFSGFLPHIQSFGDVRMTVPALYLAWFAVPILPWLNWRELPWRRCAGVLVVAGWYFALCLGPSNVWMFRWPLRHIEVLHLAVAVLLAVALSGGLRVDRLRLRAGLTAIALLGSGYLAFSSWTARAPEHLLSLALLAVLLTAAVRWRHRMVPVLHVGTVLALGLQLLWFPANRDVADWKFPTDVAALRADRAWLRGGTVVQIAQRERIPPERMADGSAWSTLLFGNMPAAADAGGLVSYSGIGNEALHEALCLNYYGATCPRGYERLWRDGLVDRLKVTHIVVQRALREVTQPSPGWRIERRDADVVVLERREPVAWPRGRLSEARGVRVLADVQRSARSERVRFTGNGELVFARLAWPGYTAVVDGHQVPVSTTRAGLLSVRIPPELSGGTLRLSWSPPGVRLGVLLVLAAATTAVVMSRRRR